MYKFLIFMLFAMFAVGQDSTIVQLPELKVNAAISPGELQTIGRNVSVIESKQIEASTYKTIDGLIKYAQGVDVRARGPFGVQSDVSIRGGHFDQTLIMIDGVKMNDPQTGHHSLNIALPADNIERIEVLQGGASRIFGPSAFAGAINFITKKSLGNQMTPTVGFGQFGLQKFELNGAKQIQNLHLDVNLASLSSSGYAQNTAFDRKSLYSKLWFPTAKGDFWIQGGLLDLDFGASNFYHPKFYQQYEETASQFLMAGHNKMFSNRLKSSLKLSFRKHDDLYDFDKYRGTARANLVNYHQSQISDVDWKFSLPTKLGTSAAGIEWRNESILSNRLGDPISEKVQIKNDTLYFDKSKSRNNFSFFLEHNFKSEYWNVSLGALYNINSQFGNEWYPGIDISYSFNPGQTIYSSVNRSLRFPTFTELYLNTATVKGDPKLLSEKAVNYELGYKYFKTNWNFTTSLFYKQTRDAIDKVKYLNENVPKMVNIDDINMLGFEFNLGIVPQNSFIDLISFNYAKLKADRKEIDFSSFYTLNYLNDKVGLSTILKPISSFSLAAHYLYKFREGSYQWDASSPQIPYGDGHFLDLKLQYDFKKTKLSVSVYNLTNTQYEDFGFVEQPGRWVSIEVSHRFFK